jgi:uncharacterized protein YkwD
MRVDANRGMKPLAIAGTVAAILISFGLVVVLLSPVFGNRSTATGRPVLPGVIDPSAGTLAPEPAPEVSVESPTDEPSPSGSAQPSQRAAAGNAAAENAVVALVNAERRRARCEPVRNDRRLRDAARRHSADMAAGNFLNHTGSDGSSADDRMRAAGYDDPLSENLARGFTSSRAVMKAWLGSREQQRNILDCDAKAIGVGVAVGADGTPYWTQNFGR